MRINKSNCPSCGRKISWGYKWKLTNWAGLRKSAPCPSCGILLIWSKWPWTMINLGCILIIVNAIFGKLYKTSIPGLLWLILIIMIWGSAALKIEVLNYKNSKKT